MLSVVVGFTILLLPPFIFSGAIARLIPALLFLVIPVYTLHRMKPGSLNQLFRTPDLRDSAYIVLFGILNLAITLLIATLLSAQVNPSPNAIFELLSSLAGLEILLFFLITIPQLIGEEVFTILPFLALIVFFQSRMGFSKNRAIVFTWLITALGFGLAHLPAYDWNLIQCILIIGTARLILTLAYIKTLNLWVSTGAHIITDWFLFATALTITP